MIKVAILGYGTVGSGVFEIINENKELITANAGEEIDVKYVLDLREFPGDSCESVLVHDYNIILNDPEVEVVIEVMGGLKPAYDFVKSALLAKKSVCTSNKELVAKYGAELIKIAQSNNRNFLFEAAVGGGIPIIRPMNMHITADKICEITGILNGTTNYILTKMDKEGADFDSALKKAQELGYAERNPEADIEGYDAVRKIAILASLANGKTVNFEEIYTEGISKITAVDFKYAKKMGRSIKLLGKCKNEDTGIVCSVAPRLLAPDHPLYNVSGVTNGILVRGNMVGDLVFIGSGAGKLPTASAVVSDVVDSVRHLNVSTTVMWKEEKLEVEDFSKSKKKFFVRTTKSKEEVEAVFGNVEYIAAGISGEIGFATEKLSEQDFDAKAEKLGNVISRIRIEG
ncbi:homoserine dehydrogenase [uncultured Eubacterium sp.]|uniref:homoserine dehydrogenase n=1 Tax=Eubacterium sp. TaxID=142586 RepID=UPI00265CF46F|nr:homoserine dehydrogenase [uncultured Eubacterium sp.]